MGASQGPSKGGEMFWKIFAINTLAGTLLFFWMNLATYSLTWEQWWQTNSSLVVVILISIPFVTLMEWLIVRSANVINRGDQQ